MRVVKEQFNSLEEFIRTIDTRKVNKVFECRNSLESQEQGYDFTGTNSYEEASELAIKGYKEGLEQLTTQKLENEFNSKVNKNIQKSSIIGFTPHVPNAIAGIPYSMISKDEIKNTVKAITITYGMGECESEKTSSFIECGKKIISLINSFELSGYRVAINAFVETYEPEEIIICKIRLKNHRQPLNLLKLSYVLIHPSFLRRHSFRYYETADITCERFRSGYGMPFRAFKNTYSEKIEWLKENKIINQNEIYLDLDEVKRKDLKELINHIKENLNIQE